MPYVARGKCVYRKDTGKKVGCTNGPVGKYLGALRAHVHEMTSGDVLGTDTVQTTGKYAGDDTRKPFVFGTMSRRGMVRRRHKRPSFKESFKTVLSESFVFPAPTIPAHTLCRVLIKTKNLERITEDIVKLSQLEYNKERQRDGSLIITFEAKSPYIDNFSNRINGMFADRLDKEIFVRLEKTEPKIPTTPAEQLKAGQKVEREHAHTVAAFKKNPKMSLSDVAKSIARDHLKEDPKYYTKLLKAKL